MHSKMTSSVENVESCINLMQKVSNEKNFEINFHNFYCNSHFIVANGSFQLIERVERMKKREKQGPISIQWESIFKILLQCNVIKEM